MGCGCNKGSTVIRYEVIDADNNTLGTYDTRSAARTHRPDGGKIRPVRVPS